MSHHRHSDRQKSRFLPFAAILLLLLAGYGMLWSCLAERESAARYAGLESFLTEAAGGAGEGADGADFDADHSGGAKAEAEREIDTQSWPGGCQQEKESSEEPDAPARSSARRDLQQGTWSAQLRERNEDFLGVLDIPALELRYPVAVSHDNEEYLTHAFTGEEDPAGCIFLDCGASTDLEDLHSFLFGHNMRDGRMFGSLRRLAAEENLILDSPVFYIHREGETLEYQIFAYGTADREDEWTYAYLHSPEAYRGWLEQIQSHTWFWRKDGSAAAQALDRVAPVLTLSTCWGTGHRENFVVHGVRTGTLEHR